MFAINITLVVSGYFGDIEMCSFKSGEFIFAGTFRPEETY